MPVPASRAFAHYLERSMNAPSSTAALEAFAVTAPGLAPLAADELRRLGLAPREVEDAGVSFHADERGLARASLWLRTASRVVVRIADFPARTFHELERHARRVAWEATLDPGSPLRLRVTCRKSKLYHSGAVAQRITDAVAHRLGAAPQVVAAGDDEGAEDAEDQAQLLVVRVFHDRVTISRDASGALLHRRGYRLASGKAPLRETLAAALLLGAGWSGETPLVDPMCGSGTIAIEGALIARNLAPGLGRSFAAERWPGADARVWRAARDEARAAARPSSPPILAADRDAGAVEATTRNAERAGVLDAIAVERQALSALVLPEGPGLVATNPPYGVRVGERDGLRDLYARLGEVLRRSGLGWRLAVVGADRGLEGQLRLPLVERVRTVNGGLPIRFLTADLPTTASASDA